MTTKIILFGDNDTISAALTTLRLPPDEDSQTIRVENIQAGLTNYLLFVVRDLSLVVSQAAGTSGIVCFFSDKETAEAKDQLTNVLAKSKELQGIPLVLAVSSNKASSLRDVMSQLESLKSKSRPTLIKEVDFSIKSSVEALLDWVSSQRNQTGFDAQPRVVKTKPKYRDELEGDKTYESLMKDKKFKAMSSINQEAKYLTVEKQRIKEINMQEQLQNFSKNKKKMTPYDIKPSPNPRIEPNLNFFLKDIQDDKSQEVSIKIQTDEFKPRPPSPQYIPKKTGIDCSTQIEDNELFDFDREVEPILNVLAIRTLEEAVLEIEEEEEIFKMTKYRELYDYKKREEKIIHREYLLAEEKIMREKQELLQKRKARHESKLSCFRKVQAYRVAGELTNRLYTDTVDSLETQGYVRHELQSQLQSDYLQHLVEKSLGQLERIQSNGNELDNCFDEDCVAPLLRVADERKKERASKVQNVEERRINLSENKRAVNLVFNSKPFLGNFVLNFNHHFDGTEQEYQKGYAEKLKEMEAKVAAKELEEDSVQKFKQEEQQTLIKDKMGIQLENSLRYGFVLAHNQFQAIGQKKRFMSLKILLLNSEGDVSEQVVSSAPSSSGVFHFSQHLRDGRKKANVDEGFEFDLNKLNGSSAAIFLVKITDLENLSKPENLEGLKYGSFGLESSVHAVPVVQKQTKQLNLLEHYKPEEQKTEEARSVGLWLVPFVITNSKRLNGFYLQTLNYQSRPMTDDQGKDFESQIVQYWKQCLGQEKEADEEEEVQPEVKEKVKSREGKRDRRRESTKKEEEITKKSSVVEEVTPPLVGVLFPEHIIDLESELSSVQALFQSDMNKHPQILKVFPHGWRVLMRGKTLHDISQLKRFRKVGDLTVESNPEPTIEEERMEDSMVEGENPEVS